MKQLGRRHTLTDFHNTGVADRIVDVVMFNESIGYGNCKNLMVESARMLKTGGMMLLKDFSAKTEISNSVDLAGWDYKVYKTSKIIRYAENAGLKLSWFFHPNGKEGRNMKFFEGSKLKKWHGTISYPVSSIFAKFIKV